MGGKAKDPNKAAMQFQREQMERLSQLSLPELEEYVLQNPELVGLLEAEQLDPSAMEEISLDPAMRQRQLQALVGLEERAEEGITAQDRFQMEQLLGDVSAQEQARQAQIESQMAERGMDSSGVALMAQLQGKQSAANQARERAMQMAAQGQQNRAQALAQLGQQAGQMEQAEFGRESQVASARDAIARANAMNRQQVAAQNLAARQAIENQRAGIANQQAQVANQIAQQRFQNEMSRVTGQGQTASAMSNIAGNAPAQPSAFQSALGGAATGAQIGSAVPGVGTAWGAGLGAAAGLLGGGGLFADGGIARSEGGVVEEGNKELDVRVMDHITPESYKREPLKYQEGGLPFADAFKQARAEQGAGGTFDWMGKKYTTDYADESVPKMPAEENGKMKTTEVEGLVEGLGALNEIFGAKEPTKRNPLNLSYQDVAVKNIMNPIQASQFDNAWRAADGGAARKDRYGSWEDGGVVDPILKQIMEKHAGKQPKYVSDGNGGPIDSGMDSYAGDRVDAKVNDGELILNIPQQQRLMDLLRGEIGLTELGDEDIVEGVPREYRDELHEKLEEESESGSRSEVLRNLMKMMGEEF